MVDVPSIGAGGGSIGWVDRWGMLKVGPQSAGADPGPACYGRGGEEPTVTDANLVLGRLDLASFLGGRMAIDPDLSAKAIELKVARPLGMDLMRAAASIVAVANSTMLRLLRVVSTMRGYDPRDFALVAFGGAGPVHACALASDVGIGTIVVPPNPGVCSAFGLLATDFRYTHTQTSPGNLADTEAGEITRQFTSLEERGRQRLSTAGVEIGAAQPVRSMDLRYVGQQYDLNIPLPAGPLDLDRLREVGELFRARHEQVYGHAAEDEPVEIVNLRVTTVGRIPKPQPRSIASRDGVPLAAAAVRPVLFDVAAGPVPCPIYRRVDLLAGDMLAGPCIVEQLDSTVVIEPGWQACVDRYGTMIITLEGR
jgi:N-methylhydantoinase A